MKIKCPACSKVLAIPESAAGKVVKCPCGKQLRAPAAKTGAAPAAGGGQPRPAPRKPAATSGGGMGGFDPAMFDELTDDDLKPVTGGAAMPYQPPAPTGNTAKLLQEHAATAGGATSANFRVGPLASPWNRLAAAIIDRFVIGFMAGPVFVILMAVLADLSALQNATTQAEFQAALEKVLPAYAIALPIAYALPIALYAWMVTKSGQTPGKKLCKIRIVTADTKQLPGFVHGVLIRAWAIFVIFCIPLVGPLVGLIGILMIFSDKRQCLHDLLAGTIVVDT